MSKFRQKAQELRHAQDLAAAIASPDVLPTASPRVGLSTSPGAGPAARPRLAASASTCQVPSSPRRSDGGGQDVGCGANDRAEAGENGFTLEPVVREAPLIQLAPRCEDLRSALDACSEQLAERDRACCAAEARAVMLERERGALLDRQLELEKRLADVEAAHAAPPSANPSLPPCPRCSNSEEGLRREAARRITAEEAIATACRQRDEAQARAELLLEQAKRVTLPSQPCPHCQSLDKSLRDETAKRKAADEAIAFACRQRDEVQARVKGNFRIEQADTALAQVTELQGQHREEAQELAQQRARTQELQVQLTEEISRREETERCLSEGQQHFAKMANEAASSAEQGATRHAAVLSELENAFRRLAAEEELRRGVEADLAAAECELAARRAARDLAREASGIVAAEVLTRAKEMHPGDDSCPSRESTEDRSALVESLRENLDIDEDGHLVMRQESQATCQTDSPRPPTSAARDAEMLHAELDVLLARLEEARVGGSAACSPRKIPVADIASAAAMDAKAAAMVRSDLAALQEQLEVKEREHTEAQDHLSSVLSGARRENRSLAGELRAAKAVAASAIAANAVARAESEMNPFTRQRQSALLPRNSSAPSLANPDLAQRQVARPEVRSEFPAVAPHFSEKRILGDMIKGRSGGGGGDLAGGLPQSLREDTGRVPWPAVPRFQLKTPQERSPERDTFGCISRRAPSPRQEDGSQLSDSGDTVGGSRRVTWL